MGAVTLVGVNSVVARVAQRSDAAAHLLEGTATTLVRDGQLDEQVLTHLGLRKADVILALRHQGALSVGDVQEAVLAPGGSIVLTLKPNASPATRADIARIEAKLDRLLAAD